MRPNRDINHTCKPFLCLVPHVGISGIWLERNNEEDDAQKTILGIARTAPINMYPVGKLH